MNIPVISVIVPCYNQAHFLPEALASVRAQTFEDWECIIVNDGSPDSTSDVAREWLARDARFRYLEKTNGGLSSARNAGIAAARGRFLQFLDSDDVILPPKLERQLEICASGGRRFVGFCDYLRGLAENINTAAPLAPYLPPHINGRTSLYEVAADWETRMSIPAHCFLFSRDFFFDGICFDETLENHEDWDCWMTIFGLAEEIRYCPEALVIYRHHAASMCRNLAKMRDGFLAAIDKQHAAYWKRPEIQAPLRAKRAEIAWVYAAQIASQVVKTPALTRPTALLRTIARKVRRGLRALSTRQP
jgi:glycosyltransferase involved in cell wall biosynthesis